MKAIQAARVLGISWINCFPAFGGQGYLRSPEATICCVRLPLSRETPSLWEGFILRSPEATLAKEDVLSWLLRLLSDDGRFVFCAQSLSRERLCMLRIHRATPLLA
jgi:hypothetical protein